MTEPGPVGILAFAAAIPNDCIGYGKCSSHNVIPDFFSGRNKRSHCRSPITEGGAR